MEKKDKEIRFAFTGNIDEIIEERGNTMVRLATVSWNDRPAKLELRKWMVDSNGEMRANKGVTLADDESADELTHALLRNGFGENKTIKDIMETRGEILDIQVEEKEEETGTEYYDPREFLGD